jgi:ankyrin repeat protein
MTKSRSYNPSNKDLITTITAMPKVTNIHHVISSNPHQLEKVIKILKSRPEMAKVKNIYGNLPLHTAMAFGGKDVFDLVKLLVKLHPDGIKTKNTFGHLPIHYMALSSHDEARDESHRRAQAFLLKEYPEGSKIQNIRGELPLHCAAGRGHLSTVQLLLQVFSEGSKVEDTNGRLPIHRACQCCTDTDELGQLVVQLADAYPEGLQHKDIEGNSPIDIAVSMEGNHDALRSLQKYDEDKEQFERKKYQEKLEQDERKRNEKSFEKEVVSLKQQINHSEKHNRVLQEARKSEAKLLSRLLEAGDDWAIQDLKSTLESLNVRLDAMKTQFQPGSQPSMTQILVPYLLNEANPSKAILLRTIEAINSELSEEESKLAGVSTVEDASIPEATRSSDANPENAPRKRARVSISPA